MTLTKTNALRRLLFPMPAGIMLMIAWMPSYADAPNPPAFDTGLDNQLGLTFSPDGSTAFWVAWNGTWGSRSRSRWVIYTSKQEHGRWGAPAPARFSGDHSDSDPFVSPDGRWLYFVSDRATSDDDELNDRNIWRYSLVEKNQLEYLSINSDAAEYSPVITASGALYFASARDGGPGEGDLFRAAPNDNGFQAPQPLGPAFNAPTGEWNIWVSFDESEIIFEASSRSTNISIPGDLYYSWRTSAGWTAAIPVEQLNTSNSDLMPRLHPDGETLYYTSAPIGGHAKIVTAEWAPLRAGLRSSYAPTLMVANRSSHEVTFVDLSRGEVVARVATGEGPHLLSNVSDGRVMTTGYGEFPRPHTEPVSRRPPFVESPNSRLTVIDTKNRSVLVDLAIKNCAKPHASWIVGQRAYVTCETENRVLALDLMNGETVAVFDTQQEGSHVLGYEPGSGTLAVSNTDSGSLTLINVDSGETEVVGLASGSEGSLVLGDRIWVGNAWDGSVSVVDLETRKVVAQTDSVCNFPISISTGAENHVWVACFRSAELVSINSDTHVVERRISLDDQPLNLLLHPGLELAYVSFPRENAIAEVNLRSGRELRRIDVGIEPDGLRWAMP